MATTRVQRIDKDGHDTAESGRYYLRRMSLASCTYWVEFTSGIATVSPEDLSVLVSLGVVRIVG
jgi:hypothetical protein